MKKEKKENWGQAHPLADYSYIIKGKNIKGIKKVISKDGITSCTKLEAISKPRAHD